MNSATITKTIKKINSMDDSYSLGFRRLHCLPKRARNSFNLACFSDGIEAEDVHKEQKDFLESLSDKEFVDWLKVNA